MSVFTLRTVRSCLDTDPVYMSPFNRYALMGFPSRESRPTSRLVSASCPRCTRPSSSASKRTKCVQDGIVSCENGNDWCLKLWECVERNGEGRLMLNPKGPDTRPTVGVLMRGNCLQARSRGVFISISLSLLSTAVHFWRGKYLPTSSLNTILMLPGNELRKSRMKAGMHLC